MSISSKELAQLLNISPSTVSMVLNNKPGISEETRHKVLEAARQYDYDFSKKKESKNTNGIIYLIIYKKHGAVVGDTPFFSRVIEGIDNECRKNGHTLQIRYFYETDDIPGQLEVLNGSECTGCLLLGTEMKEADFEPFDQLKIPLVVLDCYYDKIPYDTIIINNIQGAYLAVDYLIRRGHQKIGYLHSSIKISNFSERADGYYKALRHHNIATDHPYVFPVRPTTDGAYTDMLAHLDQGRKLPDCFFADNDIIAAASMRALSERGIKIPEEVSIIGFDNIPVCELLTPALTTMNVAKQSLGSIAIERLMDRIQKFDGRQLKIELSTQLVERESVRKN